MESIPSSFIHLNRRFSFVTLEVTNVLDFIQETTSWNLSILTWFLSILFVYVLLFKDSTSFIHPFLFLIGLVLLYLLTGSPYVSILGLSFSLHMIQMGLLYFIIPPLLIGGIPPDMYQRLLPQLRRTRFLISRLILYVFATLLFLYHIPFMMNLLLPHPQILLTYKTFLFFLACGMWWPIITTIPRRRKEKKQLSQYTFLCSLLITPSCLFFIVTAFTDANSPAFFTQFSAYLCVPTSHTHALLPTFFQSKTDQWLAGVCMFMIHSSGIYVTNQLPKETK